MFACSSRLLAFLEPYPKIRPRRAPHHKANEQSAAPSGTIPALGQKSSHAERFLDS
jgi:hypothetical protein